MSPGRITPSVSSTRTPVGAACWTAATMSPSTTTYPSSHAASGVITAPCRANGADGAAAGRGPLVALPAGGRGRRRHRLVDALGVRPSKRSVIVHPFVQLSGPGRARPAGVSMARTCAWRRGAPGEARSTMTVHARSAPVTTAALRRPRRDLPRARTSTRPRTSGWNGDRSSTAAPSTARPGCSSWARTRRRTRRSHGGSSSARPGGGSRAARQGRDHVELRHGQHVRLQRLRAGGGTRHEHDPAIASTATTGSTRADRHGRHRRRHARLAREDRLGRLGRDAARRRRRLHMAAVRHPTWPESSSRAAALPSPWPRAALLQDWNARLPALHAAVTPDDAVRSPSTATRGSPATSSAIPAGDLPRVSPRGGAPSSRGPTARARTPRRNGRP